LSSSQGFPKSARLLNTFDYSNVFNSVDLRVSTRHFLLLSRNNQDLGPRLGTIVAKKHVKLAAQRNRIKRLIRESFRTTSAPLEDLDIVLLAKNGVGKASNKQCLEELTSIWKKTARKHQSQKRH